MNQSNDRPCQGDFTFYYYPDRVGFVRKYNRIKIQYIKKAEIQFQLNVEAEVAEYYRMNYKTILIAP